MRPIHLAEGNRPQRYVEGREIILHVAEEHGFWLETPGINADAQARPRAISSAYRPPRPREEDPATSDRVFRDSPSTSRL